MAVTVNFNTLRQRASQFVHRTIRWSNEGKRVAGVRCVNMGVICCRDAINRVYGLPVPIM